ncbi:TatD family hydrolase [Chromobacterium subtsugae]|uniref:TatD family hydrolase n=1 Tax=Chromobacterium subtsugae TaxID=251747 RepID=A0ABS7FDP2_9NEIS|nr:MULTISPECIES: TatD family hydrolase [Chromobacterium]KUM04930.1 DNAase [Chromobacterium subtsugae]KZE86954.1 DNAase [Chromobacterium sp. F49]MBW7566781.1 TatD family hydrolase [Chromobacterium subtsugae]MBW8288086.1 TatD family hydrolase [Chromobacterium subtsugae]WSE92767.1 TatD family hydrolase [Chromobacterium subtsugae]
MLIDSHCHINFPDLAARLPEVLGNMRENRVTHALVIGVSRPKYPQVLALAEAHANLYATVGVHPDDPEAEEYSEDELVELAGHPRVVGIGETGLDYYWCKGDLAWQHQRFRTHIRAARRVSLPLVIHTRESAADTIRIMQEEHAEQCGGVMHCFTETWEVAEAALALGFYISFSGVVTFKNAKQVQEVAQKVPLERMLIETDSPYLAPVPHRGKQNEPAYVRHVAEFIAELRGVPVEQVAAATTENFFRLFAKAER